VVPPLLECRSRSQESAAAGDIRRHAHSRFTRRNGPQAGFSYWSDRAERSEICSGANFGSLIS